MEFRNENLKKWNNWISQPQPHDCRRILLEFNFNLNAFEWTENRVWRGIRSELKYMSFIRSNKSIPQGRIIESNYPKSTQYSLYSSINPEIWPCHINNWNDQRIFIFPISPPIHIPLHKLLIINYLKRIILIWLKIFNDILMLLWCYLVYVDVLSF